MTPGLRAERPTAFWSGGQNSRSNYRQVTWRTRNDAELLCLSACAMARPRLCVGGPRRQFTPRQPKRIGARSNILICPNYISAEDSIRNQSAPHRRNAGIRKGRGAKIRGEPPGDPSSRGEIPRGDLRGITNVRRVWAVPITFCRRHTVLVLTGHQEARLTPPFRLGGSFPPVRYLHTAGSGDKPITHVKFPFYGHWR